MASLLATSLSASSASAQEVSEKARKHFQAGVESLRAKSPDYQSAYRSFQAAYEESPSWKILGNLGIAAMKLGRDGEAIESFEEYLREGRPSMEAEDLQQFEADLEMLQRNVVWVNLKFPAGSTELIDERTRSVGASQINEWDLKDSALRLGVPAGRHRFVVKLADGSTATWEAELLAGKTTAHDFSEQANSSTSPEDGDTHPVPTSVYVGLGATGLFAIGAGVTGALALSKDKEYADLNDGYSFSEAEEAREQTATLSLVSDIAWGATAVTAGITAYLYFTRPEEKESASIHFIPVVDQDNLAFTLFGNF